MHIAHVRGVEQVIGHQGVVAFEVQQLARTHRPFFGAQLGNVDDQALIGQSRVAHPNPNPAPTLDHGKAAHLGAVGNFVLPRHELAAATAIELQAVVAALDRIANQLPLGQRVKAVRAGVLQGHWRARCGAVEHHRDVQNFAGHQMATHLVVPSGHVPRVAYKHV